MKRKEYENNERRTFNTGLATVEQAAVLEKVSQKY
jgi:hypothetical protein